MNISFILILTLKTNGLTLRMRDQSIEKRTRLSGLALLVSFTILNLCCPSFHYYKEKHTQLEREKIPRQESKFPVISCNGLHIFRRKGCLRLCLRPICVPRVRTNSITWICRFFYLYCNYLCKSTFI